MAKILGLDLGTNSIGWAIVEKDNNDFSLLDKGVRIFSEGVNIEAKTNSESSKAAQRTGYRSARKLKYRRKIRKIDLLKILSDNNLCPKLSDEELSDWRYKKIYPHSEEFRKWLSTDNQENEEERKEQKDNPYYFRFISIRNPLNLNSKQDRYIIGRAFYHIAQRRGFLSNRLDSSDNSIIEEKKFDINSLLNESHSIAEFSELFSDFLSSFDKDEAIDKPLFTLFRAFNAIIKDNSTLIYDDLKEKLMDRLNKKEFLGPVKRAISDLSEKIENTGCLTLGEYFYTLYEKGEKIRGEYTHREDHYLKEFEAICNTQHISTELKDKIKDAVFFQRPLKSQKGLVAKCPLENRKACVPISHPDYEEFRLYSYVNNIKIKTPNDDKLRRLNADEREQIDFLFYRKSKANFDFVEIAKKLTPKNLKYGYYKDKNSEEYDVLFNYNLGSNVAGCPTIANLSEIFGKDWKGYLSSNFLKNTKNEKNKIIDKTEEDIIDDIWHVLYRFDKEEFLKQFAIDNLNCDEKTANKFSKIKLKQDYGSLSLKAIRNILPYLKENLIYSHSVFLGNMKNILPAEIWNNEENKKVINSEINSILENYKVYSSNIEIVNGLINNIKKQNGTWSSDNKFVVEIYKKDLEKQVKDFFGTKKWNETSIEYQTSILKKCFEIFSSQMQLKSGRGEFAKKKTIDEILKQFLNDNFNVNIDDLKKLYHPSAIEVYKKAKRSEDDGKLYLGSPLISSIKNPMAMRSLHQLKKVVNKLIKDDLIDEETIIHIEMPRELNSANERVSIRQWQEELKNRRNKYAEEIKSIFRGDVKIAGCDVIGIEYEPTENDVLKYQLWIEQNKVCLYTGKTICLSDFIGSNPKFDIEHTIPRSRSLDNSQTNKTLCCSIYNREVKKDKIPFECGNNDEVLLRISHWYAKYKVLEDQIKDVSKKIKVASTKENRDKNIIKRTKLKFEHIYYYKKYKSFTIEEIPEGFKNSQSVDIGIISKYGNLFLKTAFSKVYPIKGKTTANLRQMWGLDEKIRDNHAHHAKDAVVVACCTRDINDALANYYHDLEQFEFYGKPKPSFSHRIPWKGFSDDVKEFDNNILISHHTPDVFSTQSKKAIRKRGIIQRNENGKIKYRQGDTVRGALHKESFYGAILREELDKKTGKAEEVVRYVKRQSIDLFKDTDLKNIVDDKVKDIVEKGREQEKKIKKDIEELKKQMKNVKEEEEQQFKVAIQLLESKIKNELYVLPNQNGSSVPIKKIRYFTNDVSNPLLIKKHRDVSRHQHKQHYFAKNDGNYCFAIYEGKDKKDKFITDYKVVNNYEAGKYYNSKANTHKFPLEFNIENKSKNVLELKFLLKTGTLVLFYRNFKDEIWELDNLDLAKRLYKTVAIEADGRIQFRLHSTSKPDGQLEKSSEINFEIANEKLRLSKSALNVLVEGFDFKISSTGKISKM